MELKFTSSSWEIWHNFTLYILFTVLQTKIVKVTFTFMLLFSWCAGLDHLFMHYLYSFLWERWPLLELRYGQNTNVYRSCYELGKIQRNDKRIMIESVKDNIQNISHMIGFLKNNKSSVAVSLFKTKRR